MLPSGQAAFLELPRMERASAIYHSSTAIHYFDGAWMRPHGQAARTSVPMLVR
jgi:hypothetical protein